MSKSTLFKKGFVVTVIVLFVVLDTMPAISGNVKDRGLQQKNHTIFQSRWCHHDCRKKVRN